MKSLFQDNPAQRERSESRKFRRGVWHTPAPAAGFHRHAGNAAADLFGELRSRTPDGNAGAAFEAHRRKHLASGGLRDGFRQLRFGDGDRSADDAGVEDDDLRGNRSLIDAIVPFIHQLDDRISGLELKRFPVQHHHRELTGKQS
jgi:hypothetical protein